ncbi:MAG: hypothetical protein GWO08_16655, partial [Gammaproteobacteria bacterium]|nr:hypothetical protein [Gammaproteobacteria bacterium]NIW45470.1 hypothetical protein [Gammaproteobacteria bacterium]NIX57235.1 hypothetical protein [candidate division Zixibacteria bacterium]
EQMAFGLPTDAYHSSFRFRFRGDGLESTDEWFFDDIQLISADSLPSDVASTNIVDATYLTKMPLSQASLVSSITYTGDYSNLGPVNTGDVNLSIKDSSGITVFSDAINGVTLNALEDTSFTFNSWDASGTSTNIYDVATYTSSFTDTDASNDTATTSIELSNAMAYDDGNHTSNVAIIPTD